VKSGEQKGQERKVKRRKRRIASGKQEMKK
jgi:hypothetical protein